MRSSSALLLLLILLSFLIELNFVPSFRFSQSLKVHSLLLPSSRLRRKSLFIDSIILAFHVFLPSTLIHAMNC
ncbi:hypothetical protein Hanom_Chr07g00623751 [Helianthus anomalus]